MKNRLFLLILFLVISSHTFSQVSYGDLNWGSYNVKVNVSTENDSIFLNITYTDYHNKIVDTPKLLIRFMDDSTISLDGNLLDTSNKTYGGVVVSGVILSANHFISEIKFPILKEQMNLFNLGVKKLRLNTSPKYHEKEWKRDKIGKKLYEAFINRSNNSFEDDF